MPDLELPDGRIIQGIPEGLSRDEVTSKLLKAGVLTGQEEWLGTNSPKIEALEKGNIDLNNRPVVKNQDGSISTVRSMSFNQNGQEILIPTVSNDGKLLSERQAIAEYNRTGKHLGKFASPEEATNYAQQLHRDQEALYGQPQTQNKTSLLGEIARPALRAAKSIASSTAGIADVANLAAELPVYAGDRAYQYGKQALTGEKVAPYKPMFAGASFAEATKQVFDEATGGLTANRNKGEQLLELPQEILGGAVGPTAISKGAKPLMDVASQLTKAGAQKAIGIKPESVQAFKDLGIDPTLADVSNSAGLQNFIKDIPLAGKPITQALQKQVDQISSQIQGVAKSQGGTYGQAGKEILKGAENIIERSKLRDQQLYGKVDEFIPAETPVSMNNTFKALQDRKVQITGEVSGGKVAGYNKFINNIQNELSQGKQVPYDSLTALRSEVGSALQGKLEPQERSALNKIYSGLTSDIRENIVKSDLDKIGKQSALQAWEKANNSHRLRTTFIKDNIQPLLDKGTPEEVYRYATSQAKIGGTRLGQVMRSLNEDQKDFVRGTLVRDLGLAPKGSQGAEAEVFSPTRFLSEYSQLKKNGTDKAVFTPEQRTAFNRLNKVIEMTKGTEQANKTNNSIMAAIGLTGITTSTGLSGAVPALALSRISAAKMANPEFVNWLASAAKSTPKELPKHLNKLSAIAASNPEIQQDLLKYISDFGISDANAQNPEEGFLNESEFKGQLEQQKQKYPSIAGNLDAGKESQKYKQRYQR